MTQPGCSGRQLSLSTLSADLRQELSEELPPDLATVFQPAILSHFLKFSPSDSMQETEEKRCDLL